MADDLFDYEENLGPKKRDNLFIWTVFILLLIGIAFACWLGSFYVFGHPEEPRAYALLKKLKKIEPPKRFPEIGAPPGEFLSAQKLFERYSKYTRLELERENAELLRTFVTNYRETKKLVPYVRGNFTITAAAPLTPKDFMSQGMVALGQSNDFPQVLIEHLYPMTAENIAESQRLLIVGNPIKLEKTYDLGAVIHIAKGAEGRMQFTVVPLLYGRYALSGGVGQFSTEPPTDLNLQTGLPVWNEARVAEALKAYAAVRRNQPGADQGVVVDPATPPIKGPEIVRLDAVPDGTKLPETGALPEMPVATPIPVGRPGARPPTEVAMLNRATPRPLPAATPIAGNTRPVTPLPVIPATPAPNLPPGVIKPFIASNPQPGLPGAQGNTWRTFKPGAVPAGRVVGPGDATAFADRGPVPAGNYLRGDFVVKASAESKAVLRPRLANGEADAAVRIIVDYPNGFVPPAEGSTVGRDDARPYEIRDVRRGATGELNIWVREIVQP